MKTYIKQTLSDDIYRNIIMGKDTDESQELKHDDGKPRLSLVPSQIIRDIAEVREFGVVKYGSSESWRDVELERYRDAAYRHMLAYVDNTQGTDEESGLPHLSHLACNIAFLCELSKKWNTR